MSSGFTVLNTEAHLLCLNFHRDPVQGPELELSRQTQVILDAPVNEDRLSLHVFSVTL